MDQSPKKMLLVFQMQSYDANIAVDDWESGQTEVTNPRPRISSAPDTNVRDVAFRFEAAPEIGSPVSDATSISVMSALKSCLTPTRWYPGPPRSIDLRAIVSWYLKKNWWRKRIGKNCLQESVLCRLTKKRLRLRRRHLFIQMFKICHVAKHLRFARLPEFENSFSDYGWTWRRHILQLNTLQW